MNTTRIAQYAAEAANISCLAAFVNTDMAALKSKVKTIRTPTALNVLRYVFAGVLPSIVIVLVNWYIVTIGVSWYWAQSSWGYSLMGMTRRMKITKVMKILTILSIRVALYSEMSVFSVFAASSGVRKYFCGRVSVWAGVFIEWSGTYDKGTLMEVEDLLKVLSTWPMKVSTPPSKAARSRPVLIDTTSSLQRIDSISPSMRGLVLLW
jgi:hypothetical protein